MIPACDGQTVAQTESIMAKTALCIASYADALSKMVFRSNSSECKRLQSCLHPLLCHLLSAYRGQTRINKRVKSAKHCTVSNP